MPPFTLDPWANLFVASAGAGAALAGLLFVAVSINITRILQFPGLSGRAAEALMFLMTVVVVSLLGLVPGQSAAGFGTRVLVVGGVVAVISAVAQVLAVRGGGQQLRWVLPRVAFALVSIAPWLAAGAGLLLGAESAMYWLPVGIVGSILAGVWDAWILLVEILR